MDTKQNGSSSPTSSLDAANPIGVLWNVHPDLLCTMDMTGTFHSTNPAWYTVLGWSEAEVKSRPVWDFIHPDDVQRTIAETAVIFEGEPTVRFVNRWPHKQGGYRWISWVALSENEVMFCSGRDVTREIEREAELAERTADRNALWELSSDIMLRCTFEGVITAVNPAWTHLLDWRQDELVGSDLFTLIHPDDLDHTIAGAGELAEGKSHSRFDNRYRHRDGSYRWISWSTRPAEGMINAVGRDFTAEKEQAETLRHTEEALRQSQKMEAVGQLTGGLAHDFNNLLAGISGSLDMMQTRIQQNRFGDIERYMTGAQGAAKRAAALTHRLLAFSRRQTLEPKPTDVDRLVAGMEDLVRRTVGPAITVELHGTADLWSVLVDSNQLENALLNLCINARDAMPDGGLITVETANRTIDQGSASRRGMPVGDYISLTVSDNGVGMAPDIVERVFEPFFTTKPIGLGTGLGLSMIHGFTNQSGGQIRVHSELGKGTAVTIFLPRHAAAELASIVPLPDTADRQAKVGETILVVDDEAFVRMLVVDVLEDLGYSAIVAGDGPEGLKVLRSDARIDLLITDVGLPGGMNGRQVADAARELRPGLKVLFITGYAETAVLNHGHLDPGMQALTKPFEMSVLAKRIQDLIASGS